ncbi:hypothetical protein [Bifidobacterium sp.]|uniref:hypothetical protein n=1 Tax=Bifidobacterium sp. TaxID=41200 RepID=UPI0039E8FCBE
MTKRYISPQSGPVEGRVVGEFTPDEFEVKERYMSGEFVSKPMAEARWDRFIRKVRADAWEEGRVDEFYERHGLRDAVNPYRSEEV